MKKKLSIAPAHSAFGNGPPCQYVIPVSCAERKSKPLPGIR
ncbi:hypothetical protein [Mucilaginibacter kameinonensis]|nr:hypothetical protein [Mucilaginibacter kameinonensis]